MKKVIRLTESDLTRIVKRIIQEEQINEANKLRALALTLGMTLNIGLSSCENKTEVKSKVPELTVLVKDQFKRANNTFKTFPQKFDHLDAKNDGYTDKVVFKKIVSIKEYSDKKHDQWFVVIGVKQTIDDKVSDGYIINIYKENKDGQGSFRESSLSMTENPFTTDEVNPQMEYYKKHNKWDRGNGKL